LKLKNRYVNVLDELIYKSNFFDISKQDYILITNFDALIIIYS